MNDITKVKLKTGLQTTFAKLIYSFNRRIKGIKAKYNINYCGDRLKSHTLDIMYPSKAVNGGIPCVIYLHGGGWTAYDKSLFRSTVKELSARGTVVFNCNYRLAPKYGFADMEEDVAKVVAFVKEHAASFGGDPNRIIFSGDSSGAHLAALYVNKLCKKDPQAAKRVIGCVYFYGVYDLTTIGGVKFNNKAAYTAAAMPLDMPEREAYLKAFSPVGYINSSLPPTLLCSGTVDPLYIGQTAVYSASLKDIGVRVESLIFPPEDNTAEHRYVTFSRNPAAKKSFGAFGEFLKSLVNGDNS